MTCADVGSERQSNVSGATQPGKGGAGVANEAVRGGADWDELCKEHVDGGLRRGRKDSGLARSAGCSLDLQSCELGHEGPAY